MRYLKTNVLCFAIVCGLGVQVNTAFGAMTVPHLTEPQTAADLGRRLSDPDAGTRLAAAQQLRRMGANARPVIPQLVQALRDADSRVIEEAAWALGAFGKEAYTAVPYLTAMLGQLNHPSRVAVAVAIGRIGVPNDSAVALLVAATRDENPDLRTAAALALGALTVEPLKVVPALTALVRDEDADVRHGAVIALGKFGAAAQSALPSLRPLQASDPEKTIRRDAAMAVQFIEGKATVPPASAQADTRSVIVPTASRRTEPAEPPPAETRQPESRPVEPTPKPAENKPADAVVRSTRTVRILAQEKPEYTQEAARRKIAGSVVVNVEFRADGSIGEVKVLQGLGYGLDESAIRAAKRLKFSPAEVNGKPIDSFGRVEFRFVQIE